MKTTTGCGTWSSCPIANGAMPRATLDLAGKTEKIDGPILPGSDLRWKY
jgi:hypothetical protein